MPPQAPVHALELACPRCGQRRLIRRCALLAHPRVREVGLGTWLRWRFQRDAAVERWSLVCELCRHTWTVTHVVDGEG